MKDKDIGDLIKKGRESLEAAKDLLKNGYSDFSASRAYYSMFYNTEAILLSKNLSFSKHKAVISAFGKEFVKSGLLPYKLHRYLLEAFDTRESGDYGPTNSVSQEEAKSMIEQTEEFRKTIEEYLRKERYEI